jgi:3-hydroxyacyl-CoA dehydrogenase
LVYSGNCEDSTKVGEGIYILSGARTPMSDYVGALKDFTALVGLFGKTSVRAIEEGVGSKEDINVRMKLGCGHPMGPLELLDFVGLDTTYYIANIMCGEFKEKRFSPFPLLRRMVLADHLGRKSGRGFHEYSS